MSTGSKIAITVVILILIALGVWYGLKMTGGQAIDQTANINGTNRPLVQVSPTPTPTPPTSIDEDLANIDAQLKAIDMDSKSVDASLNDKSVQ